MNYRQHHNILVAKHKVIFCVIPKNACSSMKSQIVEVLELDKGPNFPLDVHDPKIYPYPFAELEELNKKYKDYLRFCIVRNPWDRLVSCFKDKIRPADFNSEEFINGVAFPLIENSPLFYGGMTFEEFVDVVCNIPDAIGDHHFTSQLYKITDASGNLLVNYIGRLELLEESLTEISEKTNFPNMEFPHFRKTDERNYQEFYTDELIAKVKKRYDADIGFFNYEFNQSSNLNKIGFVTDDLVESLSNSKWIIPVLKDKIQSLQNANKNKEHKIKEHVSGLQEMRNSMSWRITSPLRKLSSLLGFDK